MPKVQELPDKLRPPAKIAGDKKAVDDFLKRFSTKVEEAGFFAQIGYLLFADDITFDVTDGPSRDYTLRNTLGSWQYQKEGEHFVRYTRRRKSKEDRRQAVYDIIQAPMSNKDKRRALELKVGNRAVGPGALIWHCPGCKKKHVYLERHVQDDSVWGGERVLLEWGGTCRCSCPLPSEDCKEQILYDAAAGHIEDRDKSQELSDALLSQI